jgi:hypothetical protein
MGNDTDFSSFFSRYHKFEGQAKSSGVYVYLAGEIILEDVQTLSKSQPDEISYYKQALRTQCLADEEKHGKELAAKCNKDYLYPYQLLVQSNPADPVPPNGEHRPIAMKTVAEARIWRKQGVPLSMSIVTTYLRQVHAIAFSDDPVQQLLQFTENFPSRYTTDVVDPDNEAHKLKCSSVLVLDSERVEELIHEEVASMSDIERLDDADTIDTITVKLRDPHAPGIAFSGAKHKHTLRMKTAIDEHARVKSFVECNAPIASTIAKAEIETERWKDIRPVLDQYFIKQLNLQAAGEKLSSMEVTKQSSESVLSYKYRLVELLASIQVIGQYRDSQSRADTSRKLSYAEALKAYPDLSDDAWRLKYGPYPKKFTADHEILDKLRSGFCHDKEYTDAINKKLIQNISTSISDILLVLLTTEDILGRSKISVSSAAVGGKRGFVQSTEEFCKLHSWNANPSTHSTHDCPVINEGRAEPGHNGYFRYTDNKHYHYPKGQQLTTEQRRNPSTATSFPTHPSLSVPTFAKSGNKSPKGKSPKGKGTNGGKAENVSPNKRARVNNVCHKCVTLFAQGKLASLDNASTHHAGQHSRNYVAAIDASAAAAAKAADA